MAIDGITREDAAALFTEQVSTAIIQKATRRSVALSTLPTISLGSKVARIPVLSTMPSAAFLSADQAPKPLSEASWDQVYLTAEEIAVIIPISETVIADSSIDVVGQVTDLIAQEFGRVLDAAVFFGTAAPATFPAGGLCGVATAAGNTVAGSGNLAGDLNGLFSKVEELGGDVTDLCAAKSLKGQLRGMTDANGLPIFVPTGGPANTGSVYGVDVNYPLGWDANQASAIAVDESTCLLGLRQDLTIKILDQASLTGWGNLAERDSIAVRAVMRVGFAAANPVTVDNGGRAPLVSVLTPKAAATK